MATTIDLRGLVRPQLVEATKREDNLNLAEFRLQPLERGYGHTLGNSMRRLLLSSLRGSAVWGFRIDGVVHEHQTIPGVVEDVHQIIGNLKALTLVLDEGDQHAVDRGLPVDLVRIDAIYNPVRRANFSVAETRVGQRTDYARLTLTVETNGTISPEEAVSYAAALAQTHFQYFVEFGSHSSAPVTAGGDGGSADSGRLASLLRTPIDDLELSVRSVNSLKNSSIRTLGDLVRQTESQILQVKNFGKKSLQEIADLLEREGLNFGMRYEESPEGVRILDWGTPPSRAAANAPDDEEE